MIPLRLKISGFLSYHDPVEVDFTSFELACISGQNGAGKSSLLDAITWVLFGQARKRDDTLVNSSSEIAEVVFSFSYEQDVYRIQRILARGKTTVLEFQVMSRDGYKTISEATSRATQAHIEKILRLDYDTFVNASFFLQGKADQFTQQRPTDRKRILASILGLELWETYRERTTEKRKSIESEINVLEARLQDINTELAEEPARKSRLKELEEELLRLALTRKNQELVMGSIKQALENVKRQQTLVENLTITLTRSTNEVKGLQDRQVGRNQERSQHLQLANRAPQVEAAYQAWRSARVELEQWDNLASAFREQEKARQEPQAKIGLELARLEQERDGLLRREAETLEKHLLSQTLASELQASQAGLTELEGRLKVRNELEQSQSIISRFREQANLRLAPLSEINTTKARLEQEVKSLEKQSDGIEIQRSGLTRLQLELDQAHSDLQAVEELLAKRKELELAAQAKKEELLVTRSSNERLKAEMESLDERIKKLDSSEGALCPLCGQPLAAEERQDLTLRLRSEGKEKGDQFRKNKILIDILLKEMASTDKEIGSLGHAEKDHTAHVTTVTRITERMQTNQQDIEKWDETEARNLVQIRDMLKTENFCMPERHNLARIERELQAIGKALGVRPAIEKTIYAVIEEKVLDIETELKNLKGLDEERMRHSTRATQLQEQINNLDASVAEWRRVDQPRLEVVKQTIQNGNFALSERAQLAEVEAHLRSIGYDASAHDAIRLAEQNGRGAENDLREVEAARAALVPLERELADMEKQISDRQSELQALGTQRETEQNRLDEVKNSTPDLHSAEKALMDAQERENILMREVGAAQQKVRVLIDLKARKTNMEAQREDLALMVKNHKTLERAFGKDGVPALLIEQALPQIEEKANELLDRLSNGSMSVRFVTQAGFKDKKRDDMKETLDIQISDNAGTRDYEMFSGGEAFRVNFAIRLALSEILARRTGARLQTLVIDEGFGSQDVQGRQRLIEAINLVKADFAKILIITHLEELKEAFPNRIEVEKTARGSSVRVM